MSEFDVLWLSVSPSLKVFDQPLLRLLSRHLTIAQWEYLQTKDEASSLDKAVVLLHDFLKHRDRPVHLAGHGMGGVLALSYARRFRRWVRSLTLLSVAAQPAATWQAHYYVQRQLLTCSREQVLANTVRTLFGHELPFAAKDLIKALDRDLQAAPCLHSLFKLVSLPKAGVSMPLLVCGSRTDAIVAPPSCQEWLPLLKANDVLWECPEGRYFFHYFYPELVSEQVLPFWERVNKEAADRIQSSLACSSDSRLE